MLYEPQKEIEVKILQIPWWDTLPTDFYQSIPVESQSVIEGLEHEVDLWRPECPVLIDAQTGFGKTTFVYKELIPRALQRNKNVLIISNRIALSVQQKKLIMELTQDPAIDYLTNLGIQKREDFGHIYVITYHRLHALLKQPDFLKWAENILYLVADEAHFFSADALFNRYCGSILREITTKFCKTVRIYMTATSWDLLKPLGEAEQGNYMNWIGRVTGTVSRRRRFYHYIFPVDYSPYLLHFVKSLEALNPHIEEDRKEKWIIFCDSKEKGQKFSESLGACASYIDADSKNDPVWKEIINHERFGTQVLITTAVLDCGVNIHDDKVTNIAVCTDDRTSLLQMMGRKRLDFQESVNLWIVEPSLKSISARKLQYSKQLDLLHAYDALSTEKERSVFFNMLLEKNDPRANILVYLTATQPFQAKKGELHVKKNLLAEYMLSRRLNFLEKLCSGEIVFQQEVYKWLNKPIADSAPKITSLEEFYKENEGKELSQAQTSTLRTLIVALSEAAGYKEPQPTRVDTLKRTALNNRLSKIPEASFRIEETPEKKWRFVRHEWK